MPSKLVQALEQAPIKYRVMIFLLLDTGMRRGELLGLEWKDIDFDLQTITDPPRLNLFTRSRRYDADTQNAQIYSHHQSAAAMP